MRNSCQGKEHPCDSSFLSIEESLKNCWRNSQSCIIVSISISRILVLVSRNRVTVFVTLRWKKRVYQWIKAPHKPARSNAMAPPDRHRSPRPGSGLSLSVLGEFAPEILQFLYFSLIRSVVLWKLLVATFHKGVGPGSQDFSSETWNRWEKRFVCGISI